MWMAAPRPEICLEAVASLVEGLRSRNHHLVRESFERRRQTSKAGYREPEPEDRPLIDLLGSQASVEGFGFVPQEWRF